MRIFAALLIFALGIVPSGLFLVWIERNAALPVLPLELGWPWVDLAAASLGVRVAWDVGLIFLFGFGHSLFAQLGTQLRLKNLVPPPFYRAFYMWVTGLSLLAVMGFWQHTGTVLWALPLRGWQMQALSLVMFWAPMSVSLYLLSRQGTAWFMGFAQLKGAQPIKPATGLVDTGLYGWVRHPIYTFTLLAMLSAPLLTLDRFLVFAASLAYLIAAIPIEERKLIAIFGAEYLSYRRRVPALFPVFGARSR